MRSIWSKLAVVCETIEIPAYHGHSQRIELGIQIRFPELMLIFLCSGTKGRLLTEEGIPHLHGMIRIGRVCIKFLRALF
jgi:hypothetical protein